VAASSLFLSLSFVPEYILFFFFPFSPLPSRRHLRTEREELETFPKDETLDTDGEDSTR